MTAPAWDRKRAAHLYRRAGFGGTPEELDEAVALGREAAVSRLVDYDGISTADLDDYLGLYGFDLTTIGGDRGRRLLDLTRWWYFRMQYTPRPLEEKMTLFWHGHFATSNDKVDEPSRMYDQNRVLRRLAMGRFGDLLLAVSRDPAMLLWLDNVSNVKEAPNENFAREVMELFTMGVGHYTQEDVTAAARAFTGWTLDFGHDGRFFFNPDVHDYGTKFFLGRYDTYAGEDIVAILAARPETASFITKKLARFFLGADPSADLAATLSALYASSGGNVREIVRSILLSDDFERTSQAPDMIKSPVEFIVGLNRALRVDPDPGGDQGWAASMGQALFRPPNVAGWKGGRTWAHTGAYLFRVNFAMNHTTFPSPWGDVFRWDVSRFFENRAFADTDALIDFLSDRLSLSTVSDSLRQSIHGYVRAARGDVLDWSDRLLDHIGRIALYLAMASPEYQLQ